MTAPITTGNFPRAMWPGMEGWWGRYYNQHAMEFKDLFELRKSTMKYEELAEVSGFGPAPVKSEGGSIAFDTESQQVVSRFTHLTYGLGFIVTMEEMEDNQYAKVGETRTQALARSMRTTKEIVSANVYNRATTAGYVGGDGIVLLSASHPTLSGNQSNILSVAADLSESSIEDLCIQIALAKNGRGLQEKILPVSLHVHPSNEFEAKRILGSTLQSGTANNDVNALRALGTLSGGVKVNHYFTDTDAWFIRTDVPNGMIMFNRKNITFSEDNDGDTKNQKYMAVERYSVGWADWRGVYGTPGA